MILPREHFEVGILDTVLTDCFIVKNQAEDNLRREKNLEEAKKITIKNDPSLPEPECVSVTHTVPNIMAVPCQTVSSMSEGRATWFAPWHCLPFLSF